MRNRIQKDGFTLIELLMALMVSSIILAAVAAFASAISSANTGADDISQKQARLRTAQVMIGELIKNCKMICYSSATEMAVWKADSDADLQIDSDEIVYIDAGASLNYIKIINFNYVAGTSFALYQLRDGSAKVWLLANALKSQITIIDSCSNVEFNFDGIPPATSFANIAFDYQGFDKLSRYEINAKMICRSRNLLELDLLNDGIDGNEELVLQDDD